MRFATEPDGAIKRSLSRRHQRAVLRTRCYAGRDLFRRCRVVVDARQSRRFEASPGSPASSKAGAGKRLERESLRQVHPSGPGGDDKTGTLPRFVVIGEKSSRAKPREPALGRFRGGTGSIRLTLIWDLVNDATDQTKESFSPRITRCASPAR